MFISQLYSHCTRQTRLGAPFIAHQHACQVLGLKNIMWRICHSLWHHNNIMNSSVKIQLHVWKQRKNLSYIQKCTFCLSPPLSENNNLIHDTLHPSTGCTSTHVLHTGLCFSLLTNWSNTWNLMLHWVFGTMLVWSSGQVMGRWGYKGVPSAFILLRAAVTRTWSRPSKSKSLCWSCQSM